MGGTSFLEEVPQRLGGVKLTTMKRIDTDSSSREPASEFARAEILRLAKSRQTNLATSFEDLLGDGGPPDETADDMVRAIRAWRDLPSIRSLD